MIKKRGGEEVKITKDTKIDPVIFWFEFLDCTDANNISMLNKSFFTSFF